jgi:hypothetical protein
MHGKPYIGARGRVNKRGAIGERLRESNQIFGMTKDLRYFLLCINVIYLSLWHSLPSAAAIGVRPPKSGYVGERRHEFTRFSSLYACKDTKLFGIMVR